jgi:DNA-binding MarR family transcriptional regulator
MNSFDYEKFASIKKELAEAKNKVTQASERMINEFVELIQTACEVYQLIPGDQVPTDEVQEAMRNLTTKINYHGNPNKFTKPQSGTTERQKIKHQQIIDLLEANPGLTRSEIADHIGISTITTVKRLGELGELGKVWVGQSDNDGQGRAAFTYHLS